MIKYKPDKHQQIAEDHLAANPKAGLFMDMGLGKTVVTLTDIAKVKKAKGSVKVLIVAPLLVAKYTWSDEIEKWQHLKGLTYAKVLGSETQRIKALRQKADIHIINCDNIAWLVGYLGTAFRYDYLVIDESTKFKNHGSNRSKAVQKVCEIPDKTVLLSGTPAPKGLIDLWGQLFLLDQGKRLGKNITTYRERYFFAEEKSGHHVYKYGLRKGDKLLGSHYYQQEIYDIIGDICISMKTEDWVELPDRIDRFVKLRFEGKYLEDYKQFERDSVFQLDEETEFTAMTAAVLSGKLLQYSNGALYTGKDEFKEIHRLKLDALEDIVDTANGQPVIVFYNFRHDAVRIEKRLKKYGVRRLKTDKDKEDWNNGDIPVLLLHPKSAGHGLNLQEGGNIIVWFGLTWNLEEYQQANKRLHRRGQVHNVIIHHIVIEGTIDETVVEALENKAVTQDDLIEALIVRISGYLKEKSNKGNKKWVVADLEWI